MVDLEVVKELIRTPSGFEIEYKNGKYILHPDTYNLMVKRANSCIDLIEDLEKLREKVKELESENIKMPAKQSQRKTMHEMLNAAGIPQKEFGISICLLRRLTITLDRLRELEGKE